MTTTTSKQHGIIHGTNLQEIVFDFYAVMKRDDARELFRQHLANEYNTEPLDFVTAVEDLEGIGNLKDAIDAAYVVCETFIQPLTDTPTTTTNSLLAKCAPQQINASYSTLQIVVNALKANPTRDVWTANVAPAKLFEPVKNGIILELFSESFPR